MFTRSSTAVLGSLHASESRLGHWQNQKDFQQIATKFDFFFEILAGHWKYLQVFLPKFMQFWWLNPDGECQDHSLVQNCYMTAMMALVHVGCQESDLIRQRLVTFFRQASIPNQI